MKTGVAILNADFSRLQKYFDLTPRGAFELSHLHNLITYRAAATTRLRRLTTQVEAHLGLPLAKGAVRTSNWSAPLDYKQIKYAASDVYAGYMLFHCMNAERAAMEPTPPLPLCADAYDSGQYDLAPKTSLRLASPEGYVPAALFFKPAVAAKKQLQQADDAVVPLVENERFQAPGQESLSSKDVTSAVDNTSHLVIVGRRGRQVILENRESLSTSESQQGADAHKLLDQARPSRPSRPSRPKFIASDPTTQALFDRLSAHRKKVASEMKRSAFVVASNVMLHAISQARPRTKDALMQIKGIGEARFGKYGEAWLAIIEDFLNDNNMPLEEDAQSAEPVQTPTLPTTPSRRTRKTSVLSTPDNRTHTPSVLHTGLSFRMDNVNIALGEGGVETVATEEDSDSFNGSAIGNSLRYPNSTSLKRKRQVIGNQIRQQTTWARPVHRLSLPAQSSPGHAAPAATGIRRLVTQAKTTAPPAGVALKPFSRTIGHGTEDNPYAIDSSPDVAPQLQPIMSPCRPTASKQRSFPARSSVSTSAPEPQHATKPFPRDTQDRIFRNKLLAFNKLVTPAIVLSDATIEFIVKNPPSTTEDLVRVPGVMPFANACARKDKCLLTFIRKIVSEQVSPALGERLLASR